MIGPDPAGLVEVEKVVHIADASVSSGLRCLIQ
jgi:hypothetical protein